MILTDDAEMKRLARARVQPHLCFTPYSIVDRLAVARESHFSDIRHQVDIHFVNRGPLACICYKEAAANIYIHQVLNHDDTPIEVVDMICNHELLHLRIAPIEVDGKSIQHPPEFWTAEREVSPWREDAWLWIWKNLWRCLKIRPRLERIDVLPCWKKVWGEPKLDMTACGESSVLPDAAKTATLAW